MRLVDQVLDDLAICRAAGAELSLDPAEAAKVISVLEHEILRLRGELALHQRGMIEKVVRVTARDDKGRLLQAIVSTPRDEDVLDIRE